MQYFDNIPFLNLDYFFNAIFKVVFFVPELILNAILFWSNVSASPALKVLFGIVTIAASGIIFFTLYKLWLLSQSEQVAFAALFYKVQPMVSGGIPSDQRTLKAANVPVVLHLALVLILGLYMPTFLSQWFHMAAELLK